MRAVCRSEARAPPVTSAVSYPTGTLGNVPAHPPAASPALARFTEPTRAWFTGAFAEPTAAQEGAWDAISTGGHALVVAPTGSGKTLAAFLWSLDRLTATPAPDERGRAGATCRVLYVSPLKALAMDVERNLRAPLAGIGQAAGRLGAPPPRWPGAGGRRPGWGSPVRRSGSASGPATPRPTSGGPSPAGPPTS